MKINLVEKKLQGDMVYIFKSIFKENKRFENFDVIQESDRADLLITSSLEKLFFIELKDPKAKDGKSVENAEIFKREFNRSKKMKVPHFGITNFIDAEIFTRSDDIEFGDRENFENRGFPTHSDIDRYRDTEKVSKTLESKLKNLANWYLSKAEIILNNGIIDIQAPDEIFILKIQGSIRRLSPTLSDSLYEEYQNSRDFKTDVQQYFNSQQWAVPTEESDFDNFSHIAILMYISKLIF